MEKKTFLQSLGLALGLCFLLGAGPCCQKDSCGDQKAKPVTSVKAKKGEKEKKPAAKNKKVEPKAKKNDKKVEKKTEPKAAVKAKKNSAKKDADKAKPSKKVAAKQVKKPAAKASIAKKGSEAKSSKKDQSKSTGHKKHKKTHAKQPDKNLFGSEITEFEADNDLAFLSTLSTGELNRRAAEAEKQIEQLIAMLEHENQLLQQGHYGPQENFDTLFFAAESSELNPGQDLALEANIEKAIKAANDGHKIVLRGHADLYESKAVDKDDLLALQNDGPVVVQEVDNILLAKKRAEAVRQELIERGVPANKIEIAALGSCEPLVRNDQQGGWAFADSGRNRRVEFLTMTA